MFVGGWMDGVWDAMCVYVCVYLYQGVFSMSQSNEGHDEQ